MSEFEQRLDTLCYLKGVAFRTALRIVELKKRYSSWELEAYMANPPSASMVKKVKRIVEDIEATV